jgi:hypothetical protein
MQQKGRGNVPRPDGVLRVVVQAFREGKLPAQKPANLLDAVALHALTLKLACTANGSCLFACALF